MLRWLALALLVVASLAFAGEARADQSTAHSLSVAVLAFDSEDAEDQADAMTGALRSRVRASQGWSLVETTQSLAMLTAALRCQGKPISADCEQRIADHIHSDRYIFGYVAKGPQAGQVTAEIHLYQKNRPDTVVRESFSDNLKDQNDDTLKKVAQKALERLGGNAVGTIVVRMGNESGEVVVDGEKKVPLQNGHAKLELAPGSHSVEVTPNGRPSQKRTVLVTAGKETLIDLVLAQSGTPPGPVGPVKQEKPFPTRKVLGAVGMAAGVGLGVLAIVQLGKYNSLQEDAEKDPALNFVDTKGQAVDPCSDAARINVSGGGSLRSQPNIACQASNDAKTASAIGIVSAAAGGVLLLGGAYLFFFGGDSNSEAKAKAQTKPKIIPSFGQGSGGLTVVGRF